MFVVNSLNLIPISQMFKLTRGVRTIHTSVFVCYLFDIDMTYKCSVWTKTKQRIFHEVSLFHNTFDEWNELSDIKSSRITIRIDVTS